MRTCIVAVLLLAGSSCFAQSAYPEPEAAAAWRGLASSYVRKAIKDGTLDRDPVLNARVDAVMLAVGAAVAKIDARFASASWRAILIDDFGRGAAAFPGETILVDARFVRKLQLDNDELALIFSHEAAHVVAAHASAKLSFMAEFLGKEKIPTAGKALLEFLAREAYATAFQPMARLQEREADRLGAEILLSTGYDPQRALGVFDKLAAMERHERAQAESSHDAALERKLAVARVLADLQEVGGGQRYCWPLMIITFLTDATPLAPRVLPSRRDQCASAHMKGGAHP
jgi:predicted Zn-dependent protease